MSSEIIKLLDELCAAGIVNTVTKMTHGAIYGEEKEG